MPRVCCTDAWYAVPKACCSPWLGPAVALPWTESEVTRPCILNHVAQAGCRMLMP